jgi:hypothetical protein
MNVRSHVWEIFTQRLRECYPECFVKKGTEEQRKIPSGKVFKWNQIFGNGLICDIQADGAVRLLANGKNHEAEFARVNLDQLEQEYGDRVSPNPGTDRHSSVTISIFAKMRGSANPQVIADELFVLFEEMLMLFRTE